MIEVITNASSKYVADRADESCLKYYCRDVAPFRQYIIAKKCDTIVGMVQFVMYETYIGVGAVSTHSDHQNQGVAKLLLDALFVKAMQENKAIRPGWYSEDGVKYLKHHVESLSNFYGVNLV